ncbi:DNA primase [Candidatus Uhrbacteria bacterium]|nr:DNA primase [Candidatus Uhrbacteria bacterium]MBI4812367.1 DNA primase [Candidatus Falkowbacteria bacterium]
MLDPRDEIKQKLDIVELIGEYLALKPAGTHGFRAICPFHSEKTPSFHVSSDRQIWHCFGCGEGGDCFSFVMKMEGMNFPEALMHLGQKTGVEIRRLPTTESNVKQRLYEINELAAKYYRKVLLDSKAAESAREYVNNRGITSEQCEKFKLGYSPADWDSLTQFLLKRGYSESEIGTAGLGQKRQSGSGLIDRFRDRLMIPLRDHHGKTVGFTARLLPASPTSSASAASLPKYINSPETPIYHKGSLLFGLDQAKTSIKQNDCAIVVEGNLDVVGSHKAEIENVIASSGTALTEDQLRLIARYTKRLVFCFDQDAAGLTAAKRGVSIARSLGFDVRAIILPQGIKDPDELAQKDPTEWQKLSKTSVPFMQYLILRVIQGKNLSSVDDKRNVSQELIPALVEISDIVEQEHWLKEIASILGIDASVLRSHLPSPKKNDFNPLDTKVVQPKASSKEDRAAMLVIGLLVADPKAYPEFTFDIPFGESTSPLLFELYNQTKKLYHSTNTAPKQTFFSRLENQLKSESREDLVRLLIEISFLAEKSFSQLSQQDVQKQLNSLILLLRHSKEQSRRKNIAMELRQAEHAGDQETVKRLLSELNNL